MSSAKPKSRASSDRSSDHTTPTLKRSSSRTERTPAKNKRRLSEDDEFEHLQPQTKKALPLPAADAASLPFPPKKSSKINGSSSSSLLTAEKALSKPIVIDLDSDAPMDFTDSDDWVLAPSSASQSDVTYRTSRNSNNDASSQLQSSSQTAKASTSLRATRTLSPSQISSGSLINSFPTLGQSRMEDKKRNNATKQPIPATDVYRAVPMSSGLQSPLSTSTNISTTSSLPWCDKYAPKTISQLAVHPTKLNALVELLSSMIRSCQLNRSHAYAQTIPGTRVLILTGPTGTAKSTAIQLLLGRGLINEVLPLERFDVDLLEYHNPVQYSNVTMDELDFGPGTGARNPFEVHSRPIWSSTYESKLKPFLEQLQTQKYPSLAISGVDPMFASLHISDGQSDPSSTSSPRTNPGNKIKVLLVDDMPYLHDWRQKTDFQNAIKGILNSRDYNPIIFVFSHAQSSDTSTPWQLFSRDILEHPSVKLLEFNPVNSQLVRKTLNAILKEEKLTLGKEDLEALVESCSGDIRSAVNSLQWLAEKQSKSVASAASSRVKTSAIDSDYGQSEVMKKHSSKTASATAQDEYTRVKVIPALMRDVSLSLFHSLGKIMYVKRLREGDIDDAGNVVHELLEHPTIPRGSPLFRMPLKASPETIHTSSAGHDSSGGLLMHYMHENYAKFFGSLEDVVLASDYLAIADTFSSGPFRENALLYEYSDLIAMRGILFSNEHPKERRFTKLLKPQSLQAFRTIRDNVELLDLIYATPNMDMDTKQTGAHVRFARNDDSNKTGITTEIIGRGELQPHHPTFLSRTQVACDVMPFQGLILREASKNRISSRYSGVLRPAEKSFVDTMCRFSASSAGLSMNAPRSGSSTELGEQSSSVDTDEYESAAKERDRKQIIMSNILKERRTPLTLGGLSTTSGGFNRSSSISSTYAKPPSSVLSPPASSMSSDSFTHSQRATPQSQQTQTGFRLGRFGGAAANAITISSQPSSQTSLSSSSIQVIEITDDIMDDETWNVRK